MAEFKGKVIEAYFSNNEKEDSKLNNLNDDNVQFIE